MAESSNSNVTFKCDKFQYVYSCIRYLNEHMQEKQFFFNVDTMALQILQMLFSKHTQQRVINLNVTTVIEI